MRNLDHIGPPISRREHSKEERRARIRNAARDLLRETGADGFSMRELADRAGVSPATPYNLFGTRGDILIAVFDADLVEFREAFASIQSIDPVSRLFDFVATAFGFFRREPEFYKAMLGLIAASSQNELRSGIVDPRAAVYSELIDGLKEGGALRPVIAPHALLRTINNLMAVGTLNWVNGDTDLHQSEIDVAIGFALVLRSACTDSNSAMLDTRIAALMGSCSLPHSVTQVLPKQSHMD